VLWARPLEGKAHNILSSNVERVVAIAVCLADHMISGLLNGTVTVGVQA
jgi:hypothetical protein